MIAAVTAVWWTITSFGTQKKILGATVEVVESQSGLKFTARVDTGAAINSLHCHEIVIESDADQPEHNSGKNARILLKDSSGNQQWIEATIVGYAGVRNASGTRGRYRVRLILTCSGVTKETLVSLNDRSGLKYPLLLGRDFLKDDFIVDVNRDNPDYP